MLQLSSEEEEMVYQLAEKLTGSHQGGTYRKSVLVQNVLRRIVATGKKNLEQYLTAVGEDDNEFQNFISALTIHFTSFFRESEQFEPYLKLILENRSEKSPTLRLLVAACSSGEEVYSLGLFMERQRRAGRIGDYRILGVDLDAVSVSKAKKAVYPSEKLGEIPLAYRPMVLLGSGKTQGFFTLDKDIRTRTYFYTADLRSLETTLTQRQEQPFDGITCRNVLIYFDQKGIKGVTRSLLSHLKPLGVLGIGHSETIADEKENLVTKGSSLYLYKPKSQKASGSKSTGIKALVVDDSQTVRKVLTTILEKSGFEVEAVDSAAGATKFLSENRVDLISLDLNMPVQDGASWLRQARANGLKIPVVIISDATPQEAESVLGALLGGAQDYIFKRELADAPSQVGERLKAITEQFRTKNDTKIDVKPKTTESYRDHKFEKFSPEVIVIGSSTGGTEALVSLLGLMPVDCPPILVVQHITQAFAKPFAQRLARVSGLKLAEPMQDLLLSPGHIYMAFDDYHIFVRKTGTQMKLSLSYAAPEHSVRPAADVLFRSVARAKIPALGVILTGMGKDGALGMLELRQAGAYTLAQDEASCVVFGMPREAIQLGAVRFVANIRALRSEIDFCIHAPKKDNKQKAS